MINHLQLETAVVLNGGGSLMEHPAPPRPEEYALHLEGAAPLQCQHGDAALQTDRH